MVVVEMVVAVMVVEVMVVVEMVVAVMVVAVMVVAVMVVAGAAMTAREVPAARERGAVWVWAAIWPAVVETVGQPGESSGRPTYSTSSTLTPQIPPRARFAKYSI
jgi:hypothetical protein